MIEIPIIGTIYSEFKEQTDAFEMKEKESIIIVKKEYEDGLFKIEGSAYIEVLFYFHKEDRTLMKRQSYTGNQKGIFSTRAPSRPSKIGSTIVKLLEKKGCKLIVTGLDAIDGSPLLDIKSVDNSVYQETNEEVMKAKIMAQPRYEIIRAIRAGELEKLMLKAGQLHGHFCPGLAMGVMAAAYAMKEMKVYSDGMEELIAITETNNCFSDGIQFVTGCSFGNNSLIFCDFGKMAFTLSGRDGKGIRVYSIPEAKEYMRNANNGFSNKYKKVVNGQDHSEEELVEFKRLGVEAALNILKLDFNKIFMVENVQVRIPEYAPSHESIICSTCNEKIMETRIAGGTKDLCIPCSGDEFFQLDGGGIRKNTNSYFKS